jgi:hypothetical protein
VTIDNPWQGNPGYTINHIYYAFKQYSAFTDPGWHRVKASTDSTGLRISAFKNEDGTELTVVIINVSDIDIDLTLSLGGFTTDSSGIYRTSETEHTKYSGTFDQSQPLALRSETITTISLTGSYSPVLSPTEESFETGNFSAFDWQRYDSENWTVTSEEKNSGQYCAQAGLIGDDENSGLDIRLDCISGDISFYRKVSSERDCDFLEFYIDGIRQDKWSGEKDWIQVSFPVEEGTRTFEWIYSKDSSISRGSDTAWIDDIVFPVE